MKHQARKRFGQHFLTDDGLIDDLVHAIDPHHGEHLVEIGPGLGALTLPLAERCQPALTVIEIDRDLAARWRQRAPLVEVIEADVLTVDFSALAQSRGQKIRVVGNLPYNISSPILFHLLGHVDHIVDHHFMLQKEVVDRMAATPGHKAYGRLTVMLQWRYEIEALMDVPPEAFDPPPRVDSAVVRMTPLAKPPLLDVEQFSSLVQVAFSQRRKLLRHTLGAWLDQHHFSGEFDVQRRAEEVPVAQYVQLALQLPRRRAEAENKT